MKFRGIKIKGAYGVTADGKVKKGQSRNTSVSTKIAQRKSKEVRVAKGPR